jgi:hypothetical protein
MTKTMTHEQVRGERVSGRRGEGGDKTTPRSASHLPTPKYRRIAPPHHLRYLEGEDDRGDDAWLGGQDFVRHHALQRVGGLVAAVDQRPPRLPRHLIV